MVKAPVTASPLLESQVQAPYPTFQVGIGDLNSVPQLTYLTGHVLQHYIYDCTDFIAEPDKERGAGKDFPGLSEASDPTHHYPGRVRRSGWLSKADPWVPGSKCTCLGDLPIACQLCLISALPLTKR